MSESGTTLFSKSQRNIVAAGATALATAVLLLFLYGLFRLLQSFVSTFQNVLLPLAIAAILATLLKPVVRSFERYLKLKRLHGIVLLYLLILLACAAASILVIPSLFTQLMDFVDALPEMRERLIEFSRDTFPAAWEWLARQFDGKPVDQVISEWINTHAESLKGVAGRMGDTVASVGAYLGGLFGTVAAYAVLPVYLFYLLNDQKSDIWKNIEHQIDFIPGDKRDDLVFLVKQFSDILLSFFRGQIIIGFLLGCILAVGFALCGLKFGIVIGLFIGLLNIVPYLGTILSILTVIPIAYLQVDGGVIMIVKCAVVLGIGQLITDYYLTPRIMGDKTGMGPMLIIFSIFFWGTALGGLLGMIMAIPLTAFFLVFWRLAREKYLPLLTSEEDRKPTGGNPVPTSGGD